MSDVATRAADAGHQEATPVIRLRDTPYGLMPLAVIVGWFMVGGLGGAIGTIAGPDIAHDIGLDIAVIGGIAATVGVISLAFHVVVGWLGDRVRRTTLYGIGAVVSAATMILTGRVQNTGQYGLAVSSLQVSNLVADVPAQSLLADYYPPEARGRAFAVTTSSGALIGVLGTLVGGVLIATVGWRGSFTLIGVITLVLGIVVLLTLREPVRGFFERRAIGLSDDAARREDDPMSFGEAWRQYWSVRTLRRLWPASMLQQAAGAPFTLFLPYLLAQQYHLDALHRSFALLPSAVASIGGAYLGGRLVDRLTTRSPQTVLRAISLIGMLLTLGILVLSVNPPIWVGLAALTLHDGVRAAVQPAGYAVTSEVLPPTIRTQGLQMLGLAALPATLAVGLIFGPIAATYGFGPMLQLTIPVALIGLLVQYSAADFFEVDKRNALIATGAAEAAREAASRGRHALLVCRGVEVGYQGNQVLFGVDLTIDEGEIVALLGTNGAGKSTLLRAISGSQEAWAGAIVLDGRDITHMPPHEVAARGIVHMPGGRGLFPGLSVEENLVLGTWLSSGDRVGELLEEAYELFPVLRRRRAAEAGMLSGGEQQMLSLAQAFMAQPRLLLVDELSLGLSPAVVGELLDRLRAIHARGTTVVIVEQSVNVALSIAQRAVFMEKGEVRFSGPTDELMRRPDILRSVFVGGGGGGGAAPRTAPTTPAEGAADRSVVLAGQGLVKSFGGVRALDGVDIALHEGEILGLIGPNGSGKTTLFDILSGYQSPDAGRVVLAGHDVTALGPHERARLHLVRRFQDARLFPALTVRETMLVALDHAMASRNVVGEAFALPAFRRVERRTRRRADELLDLLGLGAHRDKLVRELSTGLRRIVDLAVVLASEPAVLLLDEPSSGIAQLEAEALGPLLLRVRQQTGCSILLVEHDLPLVRAVTDEVVAMVEGAVVTRGSAADVLADPRLVAAYLGDSHAAIRRSGSLV